jgi:hypothetical protein
MIDCANSEVRDQLPDLLTGGLEEAGGAAAVARVEAHLSTCAACRAELELLRAARRTFAGNAAGVDVARIAAGVRPVRYRRSGWSSGQWRIAAGVLIAAIGAGAVGVRQRENPSGAAPPSLAVDRGAQASPVSGDPAADVSSPQVASLAAPVARDEAELTVTPPVAVLSDERLAALIAEIEQIQAVPLAEPQIRAIPVGSGAVVPDSVIRMRDSGAGAR